MSNGRLIPPNLDDRTWQDIVDQAKTLIPKFAPEWTDHNPSDLGITLVELFAWIVEGMIYRLNRVPDRNFVEFLSLIGVTLDPATPASANLVYSIAPGSPPTLVPKGSQAATQQTDDTPALVFETDADKTVLPVNLTHALYITPGLLAPKYNVVTGNIAGAPLESSTFTIPAGETTTIALGFDSATAQQMALNVRLREPAPAGTLNVTWRYSRAALEPPNWNSIIGVNDGSEGLTKSGVVTFPGPPLWTGQNPNDWNTVLAADFASIVDTSRFWIGVSIINGGLVDRRIVVEHMLFNDVPATNALTIGTAETLGTSTGEPFQAFELRNSPLYKTPGVANPYHHLVIEVRQPAALGEFGPWTMWSRVDDFAAGAGDVYRMNPVLGVIEFGSHDPVSAPGGHGSIPEVGSEIRASTYRYVAGGANGNLPAGTISVPRSAIAGVIGVTNPGAAIGGSDQETVEEAKRRGPEVLRNRYRAVTPEDYEYLAREATTDVRKVRALEPRLFTAFDTIPVGMNQGDPWTYGALNRAPGNVNVIVVPDDSVNVPQPQPTPEMLREVDDYLTERRTVTVALNVTGARYLPVRVIVTVRIWSQAVALGLVEDPLVSNQVLNDLDSKIRRYLHPTRGKADGDGWAIGEHITIAGLFDFLKPTDEVGFISDIQVQAQVPAYTPPDRPIVIGPPGVWVQLADYELICSAANHTITVTTI